MHRAITALLLLVAPLPAVAQGVLRGTVRDAHGVPIQAAIVGVPNTTLYTQTDPQGRYRLTPLPAGDIRVRVAAIGYLPTAASVSVAAGDSAIADFTLEPSPLELPPLDVVSTKVARFGDRPATSVVQIPAHDIDQRAVNTVDEAVDKAAGIQMLYEQINFRGSAGYVQGSSSRVLPLVDCAPMNQGDRGGINWDLLPVDQIERVDILKGAGSSLYGSAALGGVVNLTTRDVPDGMHVRVRLTGGAYGNPPHAVWRFRDGTGLEGGADVSASYGTATFGGRFAAGARHSDGYREQDDGDHWQIAGRARWQAAPRTRVDMSGAWAVDHYDVPLAWCRQGECNDRGQAYQPFKVPTASLGAWTDSRKGYVAAQARTVVSERFAWQARASWFRTNFFDQRPPTGSEFGIANRFGAELRAEVHRDSTRTVLVGNEMTFSDITRSPSSPRTVRATRRSAWSVSPRARASIFSRSTAARSVRSSVPGSASPCRPITVEDRCARRSAAVSVPRRSRSDSCTPSPKGSRSFPIPTCGRKPHGRRNSATRPHRCSGCCGSTLRCSGRSHAS